MFLRWRIRITVGQSLLVYFPKVELGNVQAKEDGVNEKFLLVQIPGVFSLVFDGREEQITVLKVPLDLSNGFGAVGCDYHCGDSFAVESWTCLTRTVSAYPRRQVASRRRRSTCTASRLPEGRCPATSSPRQRWSCS